MDECLFVLVNKIIAMDFNNMILFDNASYVKKNVDLDSKYFMSTGFHLFGIALLFTGLHLLSVKIIKTKCFYATLTFNFIYL